MVQQLATQRPTYNLLIERQLFASPNLSESQSFLLTQPIFLYVLLL